jgi:hypothetical protein
MLGDARSTWLDKPFMPKEQESRNVSTPFLKGLSANEPGQGSVRSPPQVLLIYLRCIVTQVKMAVAYLQKEMSF